MSGFEGSFLGKASRIDPGSVLECGVCWWVYHPDLGDDTWQIPPGTAFADLPEYWRCPNCDTAQTQFMVLPRQPDPAAAEHRRPLSAAGLVTIKKRSAALVQAYTEIGKRMRSLPVYNDKLDIQVIGLRRWTEGLVGIVATPWAMNILLLPTEGAPRRIEGTVRDILFPSGHYRFIAGQLAGLGPVESCSLFSPMEAFDDPAVVADVAGHAIADLFRPVPDMHETPAMSRRGFLRGGKEQRSELTSR